MSGLLVLAVLIGVPILGGALWFWLLNTPNGERYIKQRTQGPFVPLEKETLEKEKNE